MQNGIAYNEEIKCSGKGSCILVIMLTVLNACIWKS